ncbi:MAG: GGDEF domain-containing protein [Planctomycetaceae bacterium]|nr:GGDEF domain-containing protein [Planctomycetaceae bacterium]
MLLAERDVRRHWQAALRNLGALQPDAAAGDDPPSAAAVVAALGEGHVDLCCLDAELAAGVRWSELADLPARGVIEIVPISPGESAPAEVRIDHPCDAVTRVRLPADLDPGLIGVIARLLTEVVQLRRQAQRSGDLHLDLARQALLDPLTQLPNRRAWEQELARRLAAQSASLPVTLAIFDLDHFKRVNDIQGHTAGDHLLRQVAERLRTGVREEDFVARLGGDEFGALLAGVAGAQAASIVDRVRARLAAPALAVPPPPHAEPGVTVSAGVAVSTAESAPSAVELFQAADRALLAAKRQGRDRTVLGALV